jgi:replicative DNA helicase
MDDIDRDILKYCTKRDNYYEMKDVINKGLCVKESWLLLTDFGEYFKAHPTALEINEDFKIWHRIQRHPEWKPEIAAQYSFLVDAILGHDMPDSSTFTDALYHLKAAQFYTEIGEDLSQGRITTADAEAKARGFVRAKPSENSIVELTIDDLSMHSTGSGYYWRLEDLNKSLGPLRKGDFIIVAKRPEVGGTSFLVSEMSHMLEQTDGNAIIFNNEEEPSKVYSRMVSAALDVDYRKLLGDPTTYQAQYDKWLGESDFDLVHDTSMTVSSIHKHLEEKDYELIGINVLLKVGGTGQKEDHDKFQALGEECRRIAQTYGPVLAIVQADPTAEGLQYIPQDRIYKSKTALQGEADGLIMIGTDEEIKDDVRYIHVAKNKLPPDTCTDLKCKHIRSQVKFAMDTGRFTSNNWSVNSRLL